MVNNGIDKWATTRRGERRLENPVSKHRLNSAKPSQHSAYSLERGTTQLLSYQFPCSPPHPLKEETILLNFIFTV